MSRQPLATTREVAEYLKKPTRTLDQWAWRGIGPRYTKVGRDRRYRWSDVDAFVNAHAATGAFAS